jgi:type II secretory pathway component GspD/PulD (secretin)
VRRRPEGAPEPQVVETFVLHYATVAAASALIKDLLPSDAKISEFASRNMIVVKSTESSLGEVRGVLRQIDIVRQQVYIESKFMELTDDAQKDLGIDWKVLQNYSIGTKDSTSLNYLKNDKTEEGSTRFKDVNGLPYEEGSGYKSNGQRVPGSGIFNLQGVTPTAKDVTSLATTKILTSVLEADEFRLVLGALEQNKGVNIVSNPKVIVANEQKANISIIRKEPNLKQERQQALNDQPDTITYTLDPDMPFFDYGIKLDVIPSINTSSNITVQISPSLTRKFADKQAGDNTYPIIDEKKIDTVFNLADGQTAAIGGLTEVSDGEEEHKVPVLGSIPFVGRLFSWKQTIHGQKETIIFVTVGLANTQNIDEDVGMPEDAELARRRVIKERNSRILRDQDRQYYEAEDNDKLEDSMKDLKRKEILRQQKRLQNMLDDMNQSEGSEEK